MIETKKIKIFYKLVSLVLLLVSPMAFLFFNTLMLCVLIYYRVHYSELFKINILFICIWFLLFSYYSYLLTHDPSIPLNFGESVMLNNENLVILIGYSTKVSSLSRATFVETIVLIHMASIVLGWYPTIYLF